MRDLELQNHRVAALFHSPRKQAPLTQQLVAQRIVKILAVEEADNNLPPGLLERAQRLASSPRTAWRGVIGLADPIIQMSMRPPLLQRLMTQLLFNAYRQGIVRPGVPCFFCERPGGTYRLKPRHKHRVGPGWTYLFLCPRHKPGGEAHRRMVRMAVWAAQYPPRRQGSPRYDLLLAAREEVEVELQISGDVVPACRAGLATEKLWRAQCTPHGVDWQQQMEIRAAAWAELGARYDRATHAVQVAGGRAGGHRGGRPCNTDARAVTRAKMMMQSGKSLCAAAEAVGMSAPTLSRRLRGQSML